MPERLLCDQHSGMCKVQESLAEQTKEQWEKIGELRDSIGAVKNWIMGVMGVLIVNLILLVVQMAK